MDSDNFCYFLKIIRISLLKIILIYRLVLLTFFKLQRNNLKKIKKISLCMYLVTNLTTLYKLWFYKYFLIVSALIILAYLLYFYSSEFFKILFFGYALWTSYQLLISSLSLLFALSNILLKSFRLFCPTSLYSIKI